MCHGNHTEPNSLSLFYRGREQHLIIGGKFAPVSLSLLLGEGMTEVEWLWEPFIPAHRSTLLSAYLKTGKSTLVYGIISAIVKGEPFMGYPTRPTNVLLLAVEEHRQDIAIRFSNFGIEKDSTEANRITVHVGSLESAPSPEMELFIKDNHIGLIVVETISRLLNVSDENSNSLVQNAFEPWLRLAQRNDAAILVVHHNNKGETQDVRSIRGASSYGGMVEQIIVMWKHGDPSSRYRRLTIDGRYPQSPREFICEYTAEMEWVAVGKPGDVLSDVIAEEVRLLLADGTVRTRHELGMILKRKQGNILRALTPVPDWCVRLGEGKKNDPYRYTLKETHSGEAADGTTIQ